jgi:hypothetical protein
MDNDPPREQRIKTLIEKSQGPLKKVVQAAIELQAITTLLQQLLEPELASHCRASEWNNNCLTLAADNAAWATRLRYQQSTILSQLRTQPQFMGLGSIRIEVQAAETPLIAAPSTRPTKPRMTLSTAAAAGIKATAEKIEDPALKAALEKLAERSTK